MILYMATILAIWLTVVKIKELIMCKFLFLNFNYISKNLIVSRAGTGMQKQVHVGYWVSNKFPVRVVHGST